MCVLCSFHIITEVFNYTAVKLFDLSCKAFHSESEQVFAKKIFYKLNILISVLHERYEQFSILIKLLVFSCDINSCIHFRALQHI